ncbi:hypothetical protein Nepgr_020779 [Nepenthes gracilis]|uniref:Uncharacterized protein n=1 Tax=Nepenthes gracilis TaxID=150966 RepID=A0AAD3SWT2_NEPGR|nr:hypothetical protein Nepgr_020779 [Nepenthes gracilis]
MADEGFIYFSNLFAWPAGSLSSSKPESSSEEASSNEELLARVAAEGSVGGVTTKEYHLEASVLGPQRFLEMSPCFEFPWRVLRLAEETTRVRLDELEQQIEAIMAEVQWGLEQADHLTCAVSKFEARSQGLV